MARSCSLSSLTTEDGFEDMRLHNGNGGSSNSEGGESVGRNHCRTLDTTGQRKCASSGTERDSIGSRFHDAGRCRPCDFFHGKGCKSGASCLFCHTCSAEEIGPRKRFVHRVRHELLAAALSGHSLQTSLERNIGRAPMTAAAELHLNDELPVPALSLTGVADPANRLHLSSFPDIRSVPVNYDSATMETVVMQQTFVNVNSLANCSLLLGAQQPAVLNCMPGSLPMAMPQAWRVTPADGQHHVPYAQCVSSVSGFVPHPSTCDSAIPVSPIWFCLVG